MPRTTLGVQRLADDLLGPLRPGDTLLYFIRRFGYSMRHSDEFKEVCAYLLDTPDPDVFLDVSFRAGRVSIQALVPEDLWGHPNALSAAPAERVRVAATVTLEALKQPTTVRDTYLGLHGRIDEDDVPTVPDPDAPGGERVIEAPTHPTAGYGVPEAWLNAPADALTQLRR